MFGEMDAEVKPGHYELLCVSSSIPQCWSFHTERVSCVEVSVWGN